jgi:[protein-PII] uridylyltransferase
MHRPQGGFTELHLAALDRPGLLASVAGVLAAHRIDILRARIESTKDGYALDVFDVRTPHGPLLDRGRWRRARADLWQVLNGTLTVQRLLTRRQDSPLLQRPKPRVATKVSVDHRASTQFTVVDVRTEDRLGVLHAIAAALASQGVEIALAKVATEANRAVDSFYVTRGGAKVTDPAEAEALVRAVESAL